jgi:hypothetical protein
MTNVPLLQVALGKPSKPSAHVPLHMPLTTMLLQLAGHEALPPVGALVQLFWRTGSACEEAVCVSATAAAAAGTGAAMIEQNRTETEQKGYTLVQSSQSTLSRSQLHPVTSTFHFAYLACTECLQHFVSGHLDKQRMCRRQH